MNNITINSTNLPIREFNGQRVVTLNDIDEVHNRRSGTAGRNFRENRNRFIEGVDYFRRNSSEVQNEYGITAPKGLILITESGYLMLVKSFTDDLAWKVQRELVNNYFRGKAPEQPEQLTLEGLEKKEYHYVPKTLNGEPVITLNDFEHFTGFNHKSVRHHVKRQCKLGEDYLILEGGELFRYKNENRDTNRLTRELIVLKASAVRKLLQYFGLSVEIPMIEEKKAAPVTKVTKTTSTDPNECVIALGVLGAIRENLKKAENTEAVEALNVAIKQTAWEMSKRCIR